MGIFDFFKKKSQEDERIEISFKEIEKEINNKKQKIEENQREPRNKIKESLNELLVGLEKGREIIEKLDLEDKKAPERAKLIVKENLVKFNDYLRELILNLEKLDSESFEKLINMVNLIFSDFEKKSEKSFQKSTFLIGKELGEIREDIKKFYRIFNKIIKENEQIIGQGKIITNIEEKLRAFNEKDKEILINESEIKETEKRTKSCEEKIQDLKKNIEEIKRSVEYLRWIKTREEIEKLKEELFIRMQELKNSINFKALTKVYHSIENKMRLIREYEGNFKETLEKYGYKNLQELIDIKEINQEIIKKKIKEIKEINIEIENIQLGKDITEEIVKQIKNLERGIEDFNFEKISKQKRDKKLKEEINRVKEEIITEIIKINIIVKN